MKQCKRLLSILLACMVVFAVIPLGGITASAASYEYAIFPMEYMNISQGVNGQFSHHGTNALDLCGKDGGIDPAYAPFSGTVVRIYQGYTIWFQSNNPVIYADGTIDYMTVMMIHDNDTSDLWVGKQIKQGEHLFDEGTTGYATGNHIHLECGRGKYAGWYENNYGWWMISNSILPYSALLVSNNTKIIDGEGYNWKKVNSGGVFSDRSYKAGWYMVNTGSTYLNVRTGPGTGYAAVDKRWQGDKVNIDSVSGSWGRIKGTNQWLSLSYCVTTSAPITKPAAPKLTLSATDIAVGENVTVSWAKVDGAQSYKIILSDGQEKTVTGTSAAFRLNTAGSYTAVGYAINGSYTSNQSGKTAAVTAHNPSTVTFLDYDGTVHSTQTVKYNQNAATPDSPSRKGYTFTGWDKPFQNVKQNLTVTAQYKINTYYVKFYDKAGKQLGSTQKLTYGSDAVPPTDTNNPAGYNFAGWSNQNYLNVGEDGAANGTTYPVYGIYSWYNDNLPIYASITSASRQEDGYYVYFNLTNYPQKITRGRAVVTLKTAEGKLVDTTESAAFSIPKNGTKSGMEVFIPCEKAASSVEVIVVDSYSSGVPISQSVSSSIDQARMWSDWSDTRPSGNDVEVESRNEYRYRDKKYTTSNSSSLTGWTKYDTKTNYSGWSGWSNSYVAATATREVQTRWINAVYKTQYVYKHYKYYNRAAGCYYFSYGRGYADAKGYAGWWEYNTVDSPLPYSGSFDGVAAYDNNRWFRADCNSQGDRTSYQISTLVSNGYTQYQYRDISYTYYYYKWDDSSWSEWSTEAYTATSDRQVESKTTYRGKSISAATEDNSGRTRTVSGTTDPAFAGRQITLYVYKITEASDWTNEFIGQSTIGNNGSYSFTFKLREEPTVATGDFTVAIGIEATSNLIVIDTIEAPKPVYTVKFYDKNGAVISTQQVTKGEKATAPVLADLQGYTFACWDTSFTNVNGDLDIMPVYVARQYAVVLIDWDHDTFAIKNFNYGDPLVCEQPEPIEGYDFIGWDVLLNGDVIVTDNMVVTAQFEKKSYEVGFYDYEGNLISTQTVEYGERPEIPELTEDEIHVFLNWSADQSREDGEDPFCITDTVFYTPVYQYADTAETPYASVPGGQYDETQYVELLCDTPDTVIYYTTDGSDPKTSKTAKQYKNNIMVYEQAVIKFYACGFAMNDSPVVTEMYITDRSPFMDFESLPEYAQEELDIYDVQSARCYYYKDAEVTTKSATEAEELEDTGWIENTDAKVYSDWSEWVSSELELEDYMESQQDSKVENGKTWYRFRSIVKTYERYVYTTVKPTGVSYAQKFMFSCLYTQKHFVSLRSPDLLTRFIVLSGSKIHESMIPQFEGYTFSALYTDSEKTTAWDPANDTVTEDTVLYPDYTVNEYQVTFYDYYDRIYDIQTVEHGSPAEAPDLPAVEGYVFTGFDADLNGVTSDMEIHPIYIPEEEYATVTLNYFDNSMFVGSELDLVATVLPEILADSVTVTWRSSDPSVAVVDSTGTVTAIHAGTVDISATVSGSGETAVCSFQIMSNPSVELMLSSASYLATDGTLLRGVNASKNSVEEILSQFDNAKAVVESASGNRKTEGLVATGDRVMLYNGSNAVDTLVIVITGDMGDGKVNNRDVSMLMRYLVEKESPNAYQLAAMDVNGDGEVNNRDAAILARYLVGKETL